MKTYKYTGTEEQLKENGFVKINGFYFRDGNLIISKQNTVNGVGLGLSDEEFWTPKQAQDLIEKGLVEVV